MPLLTIKRQSQTRYESDVTVLIINDSLFKKSKNAYQLNFKNEYGVCRNN